jgi:ATP-dependent Clp protease, protease subunit
MRDKLKMLFRANAGKPLNIVQDKDKDEADIYLYDVIGQDFWGGVSAKDFVKEIQGIKAKTIHLRINSPGGDVFDARAMQTALSQHPANVVAHIDGLAASAASFLPMAADQIEMAEGAFLMIHNAWGFSIGNKDDMLAAAEMLEKVDSSIIKDYANRTGKKPEDIRAWMDAETWFTADEALESGFIDSIYEPPKAEDRVTWDLSAYDNAPKIEEPEEPKGPDKDTLNRRLELLEIAA